MLTTKLRSSETQDKQQPDRLKLHQGSILRARFLKVDFHVQIV